MGINGVTNSSNSGSSAKAADIKADKAKAAGSKAVNKTGDNDTAAVYEKSVNTDAGKKVYQRDNATVERLIEEAEKRSQSLRELVEKMLLKQGQTLNAATDIYKLLREGKVQADPETVAQAQKDIAEDGYWGVAQTSDRLVSFAKALTGGDSSKADSMIEAVKKGFEEATKAWGGELPDICKNTLDAAVKKLEDWRDGLTAGDDMADASKEAFTNQAEGA